MTTEKVDYTRDHRFSLVNVQDITIIEEQETLAAVCTWEMM